MHVPSKTVKLVGNALLKIILRHLNMEIGGAERTVLEITNFLKVDK